MLAHIPVEITRRITQFLGFTYAFRTKRVSKFLYDAIQWSDFDPHSEHIQKNVRGILLDLTIVELTVVKGALPIFKCLISNSNHKNDKILVSCVELAMVFNQTQMLNILLRDPYVDCLLADSDFTISLLIAAENGHTEMVKYLLTDRRVNPCVEDNDVLRLAVKNKHYETITILLNDKRIDPAAYDFSAIKVAVEYGDDRALELMLPRIKDGIVIAAVSNQYDVVQLILKHPIDSVNPKFCDLALCAAVKSGNLRIVELLLKDKRVNPTVLYNYSEVWGNSEEHCKIMDVLLKDGRFDPAVNDNELFTIVADEGYFNLVANLLKSECVNPSTDYNAALRLSASRGHAKVIERLMKDKRVDPSDFGNEAIQLSSENGFYDVVQLLMKDKRVDPTANNNYAIQHASINGHYEIVKELLKDERVDPSTNSNSVLYYIIEHGKYRQVFEVIEIILRDKRVDPSSNNNFALRTSMETYRNDFFRTHADEWLLSIVKLLLSDKRVDPSFDSNYMLHTASKEGFQGTVDLLLQNNRIRVSEIEKSRFLTD
ncbi:hypothetical protein HK096_003354, partial [Nowakowskiella sp. JEL0078]